MNRFIITAAVFTIAFVATTGTAHAQPQKKAIASNGSLHIVQSNKIYSNFNGCYRLQSYCGWTSRCYYPQYGCYCFFCPLDGLWYYWCQPLCRYVPVTYISLYQPTTVGVVVLQQGALVTQTAPGVALPVGATALPAGGATGLPGGTGIQPMTLPKN